jgi:hypothetical protein
MTTYPLESVVPAAIAAPRLALGIVPDEPTLDGIVASIESAVAAVEQLTRPLERRREARYPYPYPVPLTPLGASGEPDVERTFVVIGKHLAPHGIDFYCKRPLADRRVIASLDCGAAGWIGLVVELAWCRFNRHGWYDNGGRFVAVVTSPLSELDGRPRAA